MSSPFLLPPSPPLTLLLHLTLCSRVDYFLYLKKFRAEIFLLMARSLHFIFWAQILTVNQTLEIVLAQLELRDWSQALERVVPQRKRKQAEATE